MFSINSAIVKIWVRNVITEYNPNGIYTREQVPKLSNLQQMVFELLDIEAVARQEDEGDSEKEDIEGEEQSE